jgi:hypothetical protein
MERKGRDRSFLVVFLGAILASPLGWVYYLPLTFGAFVGWLRADRWAILRHAATRWRIAVIAGLACLYVPQEVAASFKNNPIATLTVASVYFWGVLLLWLGACRTARG